MFARFAEAFSPAAAVSRNAWRRTQPRFRRRAAKFWPSSQRDKLELHACRRLPLWVSCRKCRP
jgi:hypothetical protein